MMIGCIVGASLLFHPFIKYIRYYHNLKEDALYFSNGDLDWINKCSSQAYQIDLQEL
jgi:hypothetical protein